jgi:hypothetical protein
MLHGEFHVSKDCEEFYCGATARKRLLSFIPVGCQRFEWACETVEVPELAIFCGVAQYLPHRGIRFEATENVNVQYQ